MATTNINGIVQAEVAKNQYAGADSLVMITQQLVARVKADEAAKQVSIQDDRQWLDAQREKSKLVSFKARIADNVSVLSKARNAIGWVDTYLKDMKLALQGLSSSSSAEDRAAVAAAFDEARANINSAVSGAGQTVGYQTINLVGNAHGPNWKTSDLYTPVNQSGGSIRVEGAYLGTDFVIKDDGGDYWRISDGGTTLKQYDATGASTGASMSTDGLTLDSYDSSTGAVTYGGSGSLSGTLVRGGLGVLSSGYYNDFADDASVSQAISDIDSAMSLVTQKGSSIKADAALIQGNAELLSEKIDKLDKDMYKRVRANIDENSAAKNAAEMKLAMAVNNLNLVSNANSALIQNMLELTRDPGPAPGVFGIVGY